LVPPQLEPQRLIPQRFVLLQFEPQPFVVEKLGPQQLLGLGAAALAHTGLSFAYLPSLDLMS
jgi:hypothetical protein